MRSAGILLPITALPSPYGVGTMGQSARDFIDFLHDSSQTYWQVLPIGPTSFGDSPYQSFSTFAGNPYLIDLDTLIAEGLLSQRDVKAVNWGSDAQKVDYGLLYKNRFDVLRKAVKKLWDDHTFEVSQFCKLEHSWLDDYALYMSLKDKNDSKPWTSWPEPVRLREAHALEQARKTLSSDIKFWQGVQYFFYKQWDELRSYAHDKGVQIIGDLPIYVAADSVDTWSHPEQFQLDELRLPTEVAGCPPDGFSATGQLWGNPLFNWDVMKKDGYSWWLTRISAQFRLFDVLRIDHFRGFDSYYAIPYGAQDASGGRWRKGPGIAFFNQLNKKLGKRNIIAEDLGFLTPSVIKLLKDSTYPGMKVLEFGFDSRDSGGRTYQPHNYPKNCVAYVGTHDNSTAIGWFESVDKKDAEYARKYLHIADGESVAWAAMRGIWSSVADTAIVQMQDVLELDDSARINVPSTLGSNWTWRYEADDLSEELAKRLKDQMFLYERLSQVDVQALEEVEAAHKAHEAKKALKDSSVSKTSQVVLDTHDDSKKQCKCGSRGKK